MARWILVLALICGFAYAGAQTVLKPGDVVILTCAEDPKISGEFTITDTGLILLQYIGAVEVRGLTEVKAAEKISKEFVSQRILKTATITLKLKERNRLPIGYAGAVGNGGEMPYRLGLRLSDVLKIASPSVVADLTAVRITKVDGTVLTVNVLDKSSDPELEPGDRVFVPLKVGGQEITVIGAVIRPGIVDYKTGLKAIQAITAAGGFRSDAEKSRVLLKLSGGGTQTLDLTLTQNDVALSPGDQLTVPVRATKQNVYVRGAIAKPGLLAFVSGMTVSQAVNEASPVEGARLDRVKIIRGESEGKSKTMTVDILKIARGAIPDEPLMEGDIVDVPYPAKSYDVQTGLRVASFALFIYFLLRR